MVSGPQFINARPWKEREEDRVRGLITQRTTHMHAAGHKLALPPCVLASWFHKQALELKDNLVHR